MSDYVVGVSGASGARLALRFLEALVVRSEVSFVHLVVSERAMVVCQAELKEKIESGRDLLGQTSLGPSELEKVRIHDNKSIASSISSGSFPIAGMAVVPCSSGTLGSIAAGVSRGLLQRACDVTLKERRPLVLAFRESPLSLIHAENIRAVTLAGAIVAPPVPPYYLESFDAMTWTDHSVQRYLDLLGLAPERADLRWGPGR